MKNTGGDKSEREREKLAMRTRNEGGMILRNNGRRKDIGKICKVLRERAREREEKLRGEGRGGRSEAGTRSRKTKRRKRKEVSSANDTQNDRAMDDNAGGSGREKERRTDGGREGKHESTKATGKVSARAREG